MLKNLRRKINVIRQEVYSRRRKLKISRNTDISEVAHMQKTVNTSHKWYGTSYGGFYVMPALLNDRSVVYSIGTGKDVSFDLACIKRHGCIVHAFDPTPVSIDFVNSMKLPANFHFHNFGISAGKSGATKFFLPANPRGVSGSLVLQSEVSEMRHIDVMMMSFEDMIKELQHRAVDLLKMDIEGAEYDVIPEIIRSGVPINQLCIEFHDRCFGESGFRSKGTVKLLKEAGYEIFGTSLSFEEVSFVHKSKL